MANTNQGENRSNSKLTEDKVRKMRTLHKSFGLGKKRLAKMFGVSESVVYRVLKRQTWAHVDDDETTA